MVAVHLALAEGSGPRVYPYVVKYFLCQTFRCPVTPPLRVFGLTVCVHAHVYASFV